MLNRKPHPNQLAFDLSKDAALERMIEARVAIRAENAAIRWRLRLVLIETVMLGGLVLGAGLALQQPTRLVVRSALLVSAGCLASGLLLVGLSGITSLVFSRYRRWRGR